MYIIFYFKLLIKLLHKKYWKRNYRLQTCKHAMLKQKGTQTQDFWMKIRLGYQHRKPIGPNISAGTYMTIWLARCMTRASLGQSTRSRAPLPEIESFRDGRWPSSLLLLLEPELDLLLRLNWGQDERLGTSKSLYNRLLPAARCLL